MYNTPLPLCNVISCHQQYQLKAYAFLVGKHQGRLLNMTSHRQANHVNDS